jgi:hypothetical protein
LVDYDELDRALAGAGLSLEGAEAHGLVCGLACVAPVEAAIEDLLAEVFAHSEVEGGALRAVIAEMAELHADTRARLERGMSEFRLLLPAEDAGLEALTAALTSWCRGYLLGLAEGGIGDPRSLPGDSGEILRDLLAISEAEVDGGTGVEEQERALSELEEYIRVGVQLVYEELQERRERNRPAAIH